MILSKQDVLADVVLCGCASALSAYLFGVLSNDVCWWLLFTTLWLISASTCFMLSIFKVSPAGKTVIVTGCDTGIGNALVLYLHDLGFRVIAGCLTEDSEGAKKLLKVGSERLHVLQFDVTSQDQLRRALAEVKFLIPEGEVLWGLVNNAGLGTFGDVECVPLHTYRSVLEVNVLGMVSATKTFLPLIRKAKGRVVNMASGYGRRANAMRSAYVLSKHAVEGFTDCLRFEMRAWGVDVAVIEPGNFIAATSIFSNEIVQQQAKEMWAAMDDGVRRDYTKEYFDMKVDQMLSFAKRGNEDVMPVVEAITEALTQRYPRARYQPTQFSLRVKILITTHFPDWVYENLYISNASQ